jgi:hypothetical protein
MTMIQTVGIYLIAIIFCATIYLGWAAFGRLVTDYCAFFWLDKSEVGSDEAITLYSIGFVFLMPISESIDSRECLNTDNRYSVRPGARSNRLPGVLHTIQLRSARHRCCTSGSRFLKWSELGMVMTVGQFGPTVNCATVTWKSLFDWFTMTSCKRD